MSSAPSRGSADPIARARAFAGARLVDAVRAISAPHPVVLIDGRSGAGKSTLAADLVAQWPISGPVQLVALDSIYPGWEGLAAGADVARERILVPHAHGIVGVWQRWDWDAERWAEAHAVNPTLPLIVEGCGILTPGTAPLGDIRVWVEAPAASRKERALTRDGDAFRPHWQRWAAQEDEHIAAHEPQRHATLVLELP